MLFLISKNFSIVETLNSKAAGISISNLNSSPMQNDINFRGYVAGPLLGTAQAMAIYQNGMRVNESFGEVVQWDLVPDFAINSMQVFTGGDPIFGQNAIGGAISMEMKNGFNFDGAKSTISGGTYGRTNEVLEFGKSFDNYAVYLELILIMIMVGENIPNHILILFTVISDGEAKIQNSLLIWVKASQI